ncbi:hypothetical protein [Citreimonas sp.]|uniref:hypothetical protein n=1 Tax=Citreimonas sp. TaxID=3036715 RepID=UPI0035C86E54
MPRDEIIARVDALLAADPLPEDAEQQLEAILEAVPEGEREMMRRDLEEALFTAREAAGFRGVGAGDLDFT